MTLNLAFVGDLHGDIDAFERALAFAMENECSEIIQVGDWGFIWTDNYNKVEYMNILLERYNLRHRFCDGNHDVILRLRELPRQEGNLAERITYQHRGSLHKYEDGTTLVFMGGAPSIDYRGRIEGRSWWHEELITLADLNAAQKHGGQEIDILVTHDSAIHPPGIKETSDMTFNYRAAQCHFMVSEAIKTLTPKLHIHGHYHKRYNSRFQNTDVIGLDCNFGKLEDMIFIYKSNK